MIFSEKLLEQRKQHNMSQEKLAEALNLSRQAISKWESGQNYPDIENLILLSELFGVTIDELVKDNVEIQGKDVKKEIVDSSKYIVVGMSIGMALAFITGNYMLGMAGGLVGLSYALVK